MVLADTLATPENPSQTDRLVVIVRWGERDSRRKVTMDGRWPGSPSLLKKYLNETLAREKAKSTGYA
ncbi:unnamed protein product [Orchesella dallaii]|uniref:Uncharacterized protein n=1 Tax=Orchesella dallaii TaxID=48710 RepID=A0ABP1RKT6_9HEXA